MILLCNTRTESSLTTSGLSKATFGAILLACKICTEPNQNRVSKIQLFQIELATNARTQNENEVATCWCPSEVSRKSNLSKASSSPINEAVCPCRTKCTVCGREQVNELKHKPQLEQRIRDHQQMSQKLYKLSSTKGNSTNLHGVPSWGGKRAERVWSGQKHLCSFANPS